jgi:uncharacterized protein YecE (DUF72 family)
MKKGKIHIGTSGWAYKHWKGVFYPPETKEKDQFAYYCQNFDTVEINNSFYRLPSAATFDSWKQKAPENFIFSVKASRYITHMKKLKADAASRNKFLSHASKLDHKMGPVLFQLPPKWRANTDRLATFLYKLPKKYLYTFEFRDPSWFKKEVYDLLHEYNSAFCIYDLAEHLSPLEETADFIYIRLHGPGNKYQGSYTDKALKEWASRCKRWQKKGKDVYIYFDNDQKGYAAFNAISLKKFIQP